MNAQIQFKLMKEEKKLIKEEALKIGLGMSPFVRSLVLKKLNEQTNNENKNTN